MKCNLDVSFPVDGELPPTQFVHGMHRWKYACAQHENIGRSHAEDAVGCMFIGRIERQYFNTWDLLAQLTKRLFLPRYGEYLCAVVDAGLHNLPPHAAATTDDDHVFPCQGGHTVLLWLRLDLLRDKTGLVRGNHRWGWRAAILMQRLEKIFLSEPLSLRKRVPRGG